MEKFIVQDAFPDARHQRLFVSPAMTKNLIKHEFSVYRQQPILQKGDIVKVYNDKTATKYGYNETLVHSYKTDNKRYVDILTNSLHQGMVKYFYKKLTFFDAIRFSLDVAEYLNQNKIKPTLNVYKNLCLFLELQRKIR